MSLFLSASDAKGLLEALCSQLDFTGQRVSCDGTLRPRTVSIEREDGIVVGGS